MKIRSKIMSTIFCFSSTGNSLYVAKSIAEKINANVLSMSKPVTSCSDDVIGFVFPVYFWGLPKIVARFVSNLQIQNKDAYVFAVTTYGGAAFGVTGALNKLLMPKGVSLHYRNKIKCVENYTPMYKINDTREVHQKTESALKIAVDDIAGKKSNKPESYTFINTISYSMFPAQKDDCDKNFIIQSSCTHCECCVAICPVNNITMQNGHPAFQHHCEHCLACVHVCPAGAVQWKSKPKDKGRYRNPNVRQAELTEFCGVTTQRDTT